MQIAFYKGEGTWFNKLIRWKSGSQYSHCELVIDGVWYSASTRDGGVRSRVISGTSGNWDVYEVTGDEEFALKYFLDRMGAGYDYVGILGSQVLPFGIHFPWWYFCSEICGNALGYERSHRYDPAELFDILWADDRLRLVEM